MGLGTEDEEEEAWTNLHFETIMIPGFESSLVVLCFTMYYDTLYDHIILSYDYIHTTLMRYFFIVFTSFVCVLCISRLALVRLL